MATLTIGNLDEHTKPQLRIQAHFALLGGVELALLNRSSLPSPAQFSQEGSR